MREGRVKVIGRASHDLVDLGDDFGVQVLMTGGEFSNLVFEFLHRLGPHLDGPGRDVETEKGEALSESRHLGFLGTQSEADAGQMLMNQVVPHGPWPRIWSAPRNRRHNARSGSRRRGVPNRGC